MGRKIFLSALLLAAAVWVCGCGGSEYMETAKKSEPTDIGVPTDYSVGAVQSPKLPGHWITVVDSGGEKRLRVFVDNVPKQMTTLQYDKNSNRLHSKGREFRYDLEGNPIHESKSGGPPLPLLLRPIEVDRETGHIMVTTWQRVPVDDREDEESGAFVTF